MTAAAGYASTLIFFASAMNIGLSIAAGALVSRAEGRGDRDRARDCATRTAVIAVAADRVLSLLIRPFIDRILGLVGASVCLVLDPALIFTRGLGIERAALATVAARIATVGLAVWLAMARFRAFATPRRHCAGRDCHDALGIAVPAVRGTVATPMRTFIIMREMAKHDTDAVAAMAVINRMVPVVFAVVLSMSGAIGPIFGQNFGAGRMDRVQEAFIEGLKFLGIYVIAMSAILWSLRAPIADLFGADGQMRAILYPFFGPVALASFFNGAIFVANAGFDNLGRPGYSMAVNWARHTAGTWPFVLGFGAIWGASGVLVGQAVGGAVFAAVAIWLAIRAVEEPCRDPLQGQCVCPGRRMRVMANSHVEMMRRHRTSGDTAPDQSPLGMRRRSFKVDRPPRKIEADDRNPDKPVERGPPKRPGWAPSKRPGSEDPHSRNAIMMHVDVRSGKSGNPYHRGKSGDNHRSERSKSHSTKKI